MANLGVSIAIIADGKILLTKREDFEIWCLPGGEVDPNESVTQAAIREVWEETGLEVRLSRLVGIYSKPQWLGTGDHDVLFAAEPIGGTVRLCPGETIDVNYFAFDQMPPDLVPWDHQPIQDAINGIGGSVAQRQNVQWPFAPTMQRQEIYAQRDCSGLSRLQFFWQVVSPEPVIEIVEVAGQRMGDTR